jgi:cytochrome c biogenesis protein CcmG/thiol:disulfide interchange protein DsbE
MLRHRLAAIVTLLLVCNAHAEAVDTRWLEKLPDVDRTLLDDLSGHAPPAFEADLDWGGIAPQSWSDVRGRVVLLQTWSSATGTGRSGLARMEKLRSRVPGDDLVIFAVHTPEKVDNAKSFVDRRKPSVPVIIDHSGNFCDALGAYTTPVNVLVDRRGAVRYAGLNRRGLEAAIAKLIDETPDPTAPAPTPRPEAPEPPPFPSIDVPMSGARDMRGQRAPDLSVQQWVTAQPALADRVVVVDCWATWCAPCVRAIPHLNGLAERFGQEVAIVGLSNESLGAFQQGLAKRRMDASSFRYALGLDPGRSFARAIELKGIPHALVISRDGTIRWQGHAALLDEATLAQIIAADGGNKRPRRWAASR